MSRLLPIFNVLGVILVMFGLCMLFPVVVAHTLGDTAVEAYDTAVLATFAAGGLLWAIGRGRAEGLTSWSGFLLVALVWVTLSGFASLPFLIHIPHLSFTDAYFEAVSGLTATGATVLKGLDHLPPSINLWRAELQWLGGMGVIVLAVAILPLLGVGGRQIYRAETPGPMKESHLTPRIAETAKGLWLIYAALTGACLLAYLWGGMDWIDAVVHAFTTVSLGGFSSHDASFGYFNSPLLEAIAIGFMLVAGINFATHFLVWQRRSALPYWRDVEGLTFLGVMLGSVAAISSYLWFMGVYADYGDALRFAAFNTVSVGTTTGYATADYYLWPVFAPLWVLFLGTFASCSGSTGGGIKMVRAMLLYRQVHREFVKLLHPGVVRPVKLGTKPVADSIIFAVLAFFFIWTATMVMITLILTASGLDAISAFSAAAASLNNIGPGLHQVGPSTNFAVLSDFQTWVCAFAMLLGRLELFSLYLLFTPVFWRR